MSKRLPRALDHTGPSSDSHRECAGARLRGCSLSSIMRDRSFLRDAESHKDAYDESVPVRSLEFFFSHSWSADGFSKQMALFICCSSSTYKVMFFSSLIGAYLFHGRGPSGAHTRLMVFFFGFASFLVSLFIIPLLKHRKTMVFLDKCCIPQNDPVAKAYGISMLADYLRASKKLVILWSPNYLDRLWCVYELAVFLRTHGKEDVILVNLDHFKLCVSLMLLQFLSVPVLSLAEEHISGRIVYAGYALGAATSFLIGRRAFCSSDEWQGFCSKVKSFSVHRAKCSTLADRNTLRKLITDMYGSETKFAAVVRAIWLGEGEEKHYPAWLFSMATLRILCAPYVPLIVASTVHAIARRTRGVSVALIPVYRPGVIPEPLPGRVHTTLWDIRTSIVPLIMMSFRAPVMLIVVHKLTTSSTFRKFGKWCLSVTFSLTFAAYNCSTQLICGLQIFYHPLRMAPIARSVDEVLFWLGGIIAVGVVFSILRRSYASELLIDLSKPSH